MIHFCKLTPISLKNDYFLVNNHLYLREGVLKHFRSIRNCVRSNLNLLVGSKDSEVENTKYVVRYLRVEFLDQCGIVYCGSKKKCDDLAKDLSENGILSATYYSDLSPEVKTDNHAKWMDGWTFGWTFVANA